MPGSVQAGFMPRMTARRPFTIPVSDAKTPPGETAVFRSTACASGLLTMPDGHIKTVWELVKSSVQKYGNAKCVASRRLLDVHYETKKVKKMVDGQSREVDKQWTYFELSPFEYMSFFEYEEMVRDVGAGLRALGLAKGDKVHLFAATSAHWLATSHGAASQSMPIVTAYDTLGEEGLRVSMKATGAKAVFLDPHLLPVLSSVLKDTDEIRHVVWNDQNRVKQEHIDQLQAAYPRVTIRNFTELCQLGRQNMVDPVEPSADDLACVMYTSGSTGTPKGVRLTHANVVAAVSGVTPVTKPYIHPGDTMLAYLPLAHILEFVFENASLHWGCVLGYGNPKTLSDTSVRNCQGDIREFRPHIMVGVPAVWESVKKGIVAKVDQASPIARGVFWGAVSLKQHMLALGLPGAAIIDHVAFSKVREATGGRLKLCMNGGGPISRDTLVFISMAICPMIGGYGLTETAAMGTLQSPAEWTPDTLGALTHAVEAKLVDFPDAGYHVANKPNAQGELWLRGPSIMQGYWDNDKETRETLTEDGWLKTGDIVELDSNGHVKIIDRKKNLVKTATGEYIALEKLESLYRSSHVVANICVYADQTKARPIAIIVPAEPALKQLAGSIGLDSSHSLEQLVHDKRLQAAVLKQLQTVGRNSGLAGIEIIEGVVLADEEWTPQSGLLTAAQKLNRRGILAKYQKEVDAAYAAAST